MAKSNPKKKSKKANGGAKPISVKDFTEVTKNWQRCPTDRLARLFYAYDKYEMQTERVVTYYMDSATVNSFAKQIKAFNAKKEPFQFLVHLGLRDGYKKSLRSDAEIPSEPYFDIMLQIQGPSTDFGENVWRLKWEADPLFPRNPFEPVNSGKDAIPGAAAFLFVHAWLETKSNRLGEPFETNAYYLGKRVKAFRFEHEEGQAIAADILAVASTNEGVLCVHLGKGEEVSTHPVRFRPVLEVTTQTFINNGRIRDEEDDGDGSYFDYSNPIPPG